MKHSLETVESDIAARNHRLATSSPEVPVWLHGRADRLEQLPVDLLINAAKCTDLPGNLLLSMEHTGSQAALRVRDSAFAWGQRELDERRLEASPQVRRTPSRSLRVFVRQDPI